MRNHWTLILPIRWLIFSQPFYSGIVFIYSKYNKIKSEELFIKARIIVNKQTIMHCGNICICVYLFTYLQVCVWGVSVCERCYFTLRAAGKSLNFFPKFSSVCSKELLLWWVWEIFPSWIFAVPKEIVNILALSPHFSCLKMLSFSLIHTSTSI